MECSNTLKGMVAETLVAALLREAGYPVVSTSIETILPSLSLLDWASMDRLDLAPELRRLPDLLVLPREGPATLLEVKFRSRLDRDTLRHLAGKLRDQNTNYPSACTVLTRGTSPKGASARPDDLIRVLPPNAPELLAAGEIFFHVIGAGAVNEEDKVEPVWSAMRPMTSAFPRLQEHRATLESIVPVLRCLAEL